MGLRAKLAGLKFQFRHIQLRQPLRVQRLSERWDVVLVNQVLDNERGRADFLLYHVDPLVHPCLEASRPLPLARNRLYLDLFPPLRALLESVLRHSPSRPFLSPATVCTWISSLRLLPTSLFHAVEMAS